MYKNTVTARPNIPKIKIVTVGGFDDAGRPDGGWQFDGRDTPGSVGYYVCDGRELVGGYTIKELREIKQLDDNKGE